MAKASDFDPNDQPRLADGTYTFKQLREVRGGTLDLMGASTNPAYLDRVLGSVERHNALLSGGYVEPTFFSATTDPKTRAGIDADWEQAFASGGYNPDDSGYPKMPDNYTPGGHAGRSLDGHLRTYRRKYEVDGWTVRMNGSVTACKRFSHEHGRTFEMPVTIEDPEGRHVKGWVRVTNGGAGNWAVTPLGMSGPKGQLVAASVQAALEARRPTQIPRHAGGLMGRARERAAATGSAPDHRLISTWMDSVGYDDAEGMMVTKTSTGRLYGHTVPREVFEKIATSTKPGQIFNQLVKKGTDAQRVPIETCGRCSRVYGAGRAHKCPPTPATASTTPLVTNQISRAGALSVAAGAMAVRRRMQARLAQQQPKT